MNRAHNSLGLSARLKPRVEKLYGTKQAAVLTQQLVDLAAAFQEGPKQTEAARLWDQNDIILIVYGDSLGCPECRPLETLCLFLEQYLKGYVNIVHLLPFFPYSSDDGFAVIDYQQVNPQLGSWDDIALIRRSFELMFDLVINHVSSQHRWFQQFIAGEEPGKDFFILPPADADLSNVVRPRESPLLTPVATVEGPRKVWSTFSADQLDVDFSNPRVLQEYISILLGYLARGARFIRLDAVAFLWKEWGTSCMNLPQTHEVVRLLRDIVATIAPKTVLLSETNVPHQQNISYFGDSNEAHMIYQFSLAPLLLHGLYRGTSQYLTDWARTSCLTPPDCTFLNFTASHDGIGMRPLEGLLPQGEVELLLKGMENFGGLISYRHSSDGSKSAYEINITYFDALKGTWMGQDSWQLARFLLSQTLMLGLRGIPAFYIHSLLATENDYAGVRQSGRARLINRHKWDRDKLERLLADNDTNQALVFNELRRRIEIRKRQAAFHPDARQEILFLGHHLFGFWRHSLDGVQSILAVHNLTDQPRKLYLDGPLDGLTGCWTGLLTGEQVSAAQAVIDLPPYHVLWLEQQQN